MRLLLLAPPMVTQRRILLVSLIALPFALVLGCDKVPLLAPTGSVISLLPATTTVSLNSEIAIVATVIENGQSSSTTGTGSGATTSTSRAGAGTPVQNGTLVTFTTTLGRIEPSEARTHNGAVTVKLVSGGSSGTATITAFSGGASASTQLKVGTAAVGRVSLTTTPQSLTAGGGTATVSATVTDDGGNAVGGVPVTFSTDTGSVSPSTAVTHVNGVATAPLTTSGTSKITATAGSQNGTATLTVSPRSLQGFSASPSSTTAGTPVTFTVTPAAGANISNVHIDFGDGTSRDTGPIVAGSATAPQATSVQKVYNSAGVFNATATPFDASGSSGALTTSVVVSSLAVGLTAAPNPATAGLPTTLTASVPAGTAVDHFVFNFSDGRAPVSTANPTISQTFTQRGLETVRVDVIGVGGSAPIGTSAISFTVQ